MRWESIRGAAALALGALAGAAQADTVTLNSWYYGSAGSADVSFINQTVNAGGINATVNFSGSDANAGFGSSIANFVTYCVELNQDSTLSTSVTNYQLIQGSADREWNGANGSSNTAQGVSKRLGQLMSYVDSNKLVTNAAQSASLQLAIWNVIYDNDNTVNAGLFQDLSDSKYDGYANQLLAGSASWSNYLSVWVLQSPTNQDFLLTSAGGTIPEPTTGALAGLALAAGFMVRRRCKPSLQRADFLAAP